VERAIRWIKERLSGSLMFRSENIEYIKGGDKVNIFSQTSPVFLLNLKPHSIL